MQVQGSADQRELESRARARPVMVLHELSRLIRAAFFRTVSVYVSLVYLIEVILPRCRLHLDSAV